MWTWVDPRNCILDGVQILLQKGHLEYALPNGQPTVSRYWRHKWKRKDELETVDKWSKNSDDRPHCRGRFFIKKILCDIWLLLLANWNAAQQHSGKSQHQGYWEWCSAMCRKIRSHPPQECPFCSKIWTPSNMRSLGPPESTSQTSSCLVHLFLQNIKKIHCSNFKVFLEISWGPGLTRKQVT